jgi:hypothetical protein
MSPYLLSFNKDNLLKITCQKSKKKSLSLSQPNPPYFLTHPITHPLNHLLTDPLTHLFTHPPTTPSLTPPQHPQTLLPPSPPRHPQHPPRNPRHPPRHPQHLQGPQKQHKNSHKQLPQRARESDSTSTAQTPSRPSTFPRTRGTAREWGCRARARLGSSRMHAANERTW